MDIVIKTALLGFTKKIVIIHVYNAHNFNVLLVIQVIRIFVYLALKTILILIILV